MRAGGRTRRASAPLPPPDAAPSVWGFDVVNTAEAGHDAFLPLGIVAEHTTTIRLGTNVAIAFARSPWRRPRSPGICSICPAGVFNSDWAPR